MTYQLTGSISKKAIYLLALCFLAVLPTFISCSTGNSPAPTSSQNTNSGASAPRQTGRCFLQGRSMEECGYGLYSYLLLGSHPNNANRERYLKAVIAFLQFLPELKELEDNDISRRALNITYVPILGDKEPPSIPRSTYNSKGDSSVFKDLAEWVLENYNYARAYTYLNAIPGAPHLEGPYFVSTLKPLAGMDTITGQYLFQDLSSVPPDIIAPWIKEFINQAAQEKFWEARNMVLPKIKTKSRLN